VHLRRQRDFSGEAGVSEILGVTMLLAMVVTIMGGLVIFLQPFMQDLNDNRVWSAGSATATGFNDRLMVVAGMPEGNGVSHIIGDAGSAIDALISAEIWHISADLAGHDRVSITIEATNVTIDSMNGTAVTVRIILAGEEIENWTLTNGTGTFDLITDYRALLEIEVLDRDGTIIHRSVRVSLDGLRMIHAMTRGTFTIDLTNGARHERLPNGLIDIRAFPRLEQDIDLDGRNRVTLVLLDVDFNGRGSQSANRVELISLGALNLLESNSARNLNLKMQIGGDSTLERQYIDHWSRDHDVYRATGDLDSYSGFGPDGRLSGIDGLTFHPSEESIQLAVVLQRIEVKV
jgi:hypothetical protein